MCKQFLLTGYPDLAKINLMCFSICQAWTSLFHALPLISVSVAGSDDRLRSIRWIVDYLYWKFTTLNVTIDEAIIPFKVLYTARVALQKKTACHRMGDVFTNFVHRHSKWTTKSPLFRCPQMLHFYETLPGLIIFVPICISFRYIYPMVATPLLHR
ncbi:hypothetical protein Pelo_14286 [Pelomyxa schiedti]|nr:hypothetical protein Pelo_14286 [Pelomyxa schiedti]